MIIKITSDRLSLKFEGTEKKCMKLLKNFRKAQLDHVGPKPFTYSTQSTYYTKLDADFYQRSKASKMTILIINE